MRSCREERKSSIASWVAVQLHYHIKGVSRYRETLEHSRSNYRAVSSERCHFPLCSPSPFPVLIPTKKLARLLGGGNRSSSLSIEMGNRNGNVEQTARRGLLSVQTKSEKDGAASASVGDGFGLSRPDPRAPTVCRCLFTNKCRRSCNCNEA